MRHGRQQLVEDRCGDRDVHGGEQYLQNRHSHAGQLDILAEQAHAAQHASEGDVAEHDGPEQGANAVHCGARQVGAEERDGARFDEQDGAAQHHAAEAERQAAEGDGLGDLHRGQAPMRVQPIADRGARHRGKAQVVRQRVGAERGEGDAAVGYLVARIDGAEPVVEGQHKIRQDRPAKRQRQGPRRDRVQCRADVAQAEMAELTLHDVNGADQQDNTKQSGQVAEPCLHRPGNGRPRHGVRLHLPGE